MRKEILDNDSTLFSSVLEWLLTIQPPDKIKVVFGVFELESKLLVPHGPPQNIMQAVR